jgi:hypothetical protein
MSKSSRYFCIHGHFYQPPRENPLFDQIELQPSAQPAHDWNERVFSECYAPNAASRILDGNGRIRDILNNYAYMSFNIGPTLFSWLEEKHPYTYDRILEADRQSMERLEGHGNAMAQVYNHAIMPLCTEEQRALQIKWGIADFERRFGRRPEGMWLAETAINLDTVVSLIREGVKFTVLAPTQAHKVRPLNGEAWTDVSGNTIDPRRPYRVFPIAEDGTPIEKGYLDVFFYDGPISHGVGFEHLLKDAKRFGDRINGAFDHASKEPQLVSVCTDGESYGHHEPFGDMCAAFLFHDVAARLDMVPVNYAWYLARHPPRHEVRLKNAYREGTAWSCAHGVGRWKEDCGCSTGGQDGWNQAWRGPFRRALDILVAEAEKRIAQEGPGLFIDWPQARDGAIGSWDIDPGIRKAWWESHLAPGADRARAVAIMDTLRFSQYVYTSCAWFFSELTGIETVQNLKYALRTLHLLEGLGTPPTLRARFLAQLAEANSNLGGRAGDEIFNELERETLPLHAYLALGNWVEDLGEEPFAYSATQGWKLSSKLSRTHGPWTVRETRFAHDFTGERMNAWLMFREGGLDAESFYYLQGADLALEGWRPEADPESTGPADWFASAGPAAAPGQPRYPLVLFPKGLPIDVRDRIAIHLKHEFWQESEAEVRMQEARLDAKQKQFRRLGWPLPQSILQTLTIIENFRLVEALLRGLRNEDTAEMLRALSLAVKLRSHGVLAHLGPAKHHLHNYLLNLGQRLVDHPEKMDLKPFFVLLDLVDTLRLNLERYRIENLAHPILKGLESWCEEGGLPVKFDPGDAILLLDRLNFNTESAKRYLETRKAAAP